MVHYGILCSGLLVLAAQPAVVKYEIRGTVLEEGTTRVLAGAEVAISYLGEQRAGIISTVALMNPAFQEKTSLVGTFSFAPAQPGLYLVRVRKDGYGSAREPSVSVFVSDEQPRHDVKMSLARAGMITGRLLDDETREPVKNQRIWLEQATYRWGVLQPAPAGSAVTNAEGRFVVSPLQPGEYLINTRQQGQGREMVVRPFTQKDAELVDREDEEQVWPGGGTYDTAVPLVLASGGELNAGDIRLRKANYHRVRVVTKGSGCEAGETLQLSVLAPGRGGRKTPVGVSSVRCGEGLLLKGFAPGYYWLLVRLQAIRQALVEVKIEDKNLTTGFQLESGLKLTARLRAAEGGKLPAREGLTLSLLPVDGVTAGSPLRPVSLDGEGVARWESVFPGLYSLSLMPPLKTQVVQEIFYGGLSSGQGPVNVRRDVARQELEVVLSDKPATVSGQISVRGKAVADATVVLLKAGGAISPLETKADGTGQFRFVALAAGTYRLVAVTPEGYAAMQKPGRLLAAYNSASDITLGPSGARTLTIEPVE